MLYSMLVDRKPDKQQLYLQHQKHVAQNSNGDRVGHSRHFRQCTPVPYRGTFCTKKNRGCRKSTKKMSKG